MPSIRKIPKMKKGRIGMITFLITRFMMSRNSPRTFTIVSLLEYAAPRPRTNARIRAVITSKAGGMSIVKKGWKEDVSLTVANVKEGSLTSMNG